MTVFSWAVFLWRKAVRWLKANWKWIIFPIGLAAAFISLVSKGARLLPPRRKIEEKERVAEDHDMQVIDNEAERRAELARIVAQQKEDLDVLRNESLQNLAKWIDKVDN